MPFDAMKKSCAPNQYCRPHPQSDFSRKYYRSSDSRFVEPLQPQRRQVFPANNPRPPPPGPGTATKPNFIIHLVSEVRSVQKVDVRALIAECKSEPYQQHVLHFDNTAAALFYRQWVDALEAMVVFWELRLDGVHSFTPKLKSNVHVPSDIEEPNDRLRALFSDRVKRLLKGEEVQKWRSKCESVWQEITRLSHKLRKIQPLQVNIDLSEKKKGLVSERGLILKRIREFESAMNCILNHLEGKKREECGEEVVEVFNFPSDFNWCRIHSLMLRECHRLQEGLPIYAYRQELLRHILSLQTMLLIGETGSGKSTQLAQFLADSGVAASESIVCTQPRKIAAISLAHRVREESSGCYKDDAIIFQSSYYSDEKCNSKVLYMTDHCLLQHYMNNKDMSGISCIIIDEAHERSLNTDLLLSLVRSLLLKNRKDLRLVIMSATADAKKLSEYFFDCAIFHVVGRNFPVDVRYIPCGTEGSSGSDIIASYVSDVVRLASEIHKTETDGTILAFLTSQMEVEWACENFEAPAAIPLALHGKLSFEEQFRVFQDYPGKRKVIFSTNLAETSLTIPGVKYVIDPGLAKESNFEPGSGMNVLKVCRISQSSANQRAGRAGRTEPGRCYRLYSESDYESMPHNQEPEICRVHLGVAVLRILALGVEKVDDFDFVDAPSPEAIAMAIRNLVQLGAVRLNNHVYKLTDQGRCIVKLGIEPRLGKLILSCFKHQLGREGVVLAAVMANSSSIFCRVGNHEDKLKSDCLKVQFCHRDGDLFTLLSVYQEWELLPRERKNKWCWENSINAKTMRRCQDTIVELENCLKRELNFIIPSYWHWNPQKITCHNTHLKKAILASLAENVAMFSGHNQLGYKVALTGQHVQLHPSCSLLIFRQKPNWVVFGEILSVSNEYLVCVTAFDFESLSSLCPPPLFNVSDMENHRLQARTLTGLGSILLKRFCGKSNANILSLESRIRKACLDDRIGIKVDVDQNAIMLYATAKDMETAFTCVNDVLDCERKWLQNECVEKYLYHGPGGSPAAALFGAGAEIKYLELQKGCSTVDVFHSNIDAIDEKELLMFLEKTVAGSICAIHKMTGVGQKCDDTEKGCRITFLTPDAAEKAAELKDMVFRGSMVKVIASHSTSGDHKMFSFPAVKAKIFWPRRLSKGFAIVKCDLIDVGFMVHELSNLLIGGKHVHCEPSNKSMDSLCISGIDKGLSEAEILAVLKTATGRKILDFFLVRGDVVENPPTDACEEAIRKEIFPFMPKWNPHVNCYRVQVFHPEAKDAFMKASITFDGRMHLEAAKALEHLEGKSLPGCFSWQKVKCQQLFETSLSCPVPVYHVVKNQLDSLLMSFRRMRGVECSLDRNANGSYRVKMSANATKTVAELRRPVEELMRGKIIDNPSLTPTILQHLLSRDGFNLIIQTQQETGTYIRFDKHSLIVRIFGSGVKINAAEQKLVKSLLTHYETKQLEIHLRCSTLPPDVLKEVVKKFGPDLHGLKEKVPGAEFTLNTRRHIIYMHGSKDLKQKVEELIYDIAQTRDGLTEIPKNESTCPICLCEVEDAYRLEDCAHIFCRMCLIEQLESAIRNHDSFPILCSRQNCRSPILLTDLRSLLTGEKLEELFRASLVAFVESSGGTYRFCPSPDCPSVYQANDSTTPGEPFVCGACYAETCTRCHLEYHPHVSCEIYKGFKEDPDSSLEEWRKDKMHVKNCPVCRHTIEKESGCNHITCRCGKHICWVCLESYESSEDCYGHLRTIHGSITDEIL